MSESERIKLFDTQAEYAEIGPEIESAVFRVLRSGRFVGGPEVEAFESEFSAVVDGASVAGVGSGTDALRLALAALGVGPGDEVIVPANTFSATVMAVEAVGATPVIADVDPELFVVTPEQVMPLVGPRTRCVMPVHLYGHPAPLHLLREVLDERILIVEDAAQAHGATIEGKPVGGWGAAAGFSFYPSKNLGAYGDGGAVAADADVVAKVKVLRDLGRDSAGDHVEVGTNSRLDALQAAILRCKLLHLDEWSKQRRDLADRYRSLLKDLSVTVPTEAAWGSHVYHLFVVQVPERDRLARALASAGIETGIHYATPIHLQAAHAGRVLVPRGAPTSERLSRSILSLPLYPQLTEDQQDRVVSVLEANL